MSIEIAIFASVILGVIAGLLLENMRRRIEPEAAGAAAAKAAPLRLMGPDSTRPGDAFNGRAADNAADLRLVSDAGFASKPLLSGREADVLAVVETIATEAGLGWRVVPQVRLVDIIASSDAGANSVIGDHRIDMLIVSAQRMPVAAVDYQALGQLQDDSALRDAVKREALRRAGIPFLEVRANEPLDVVRAQILRLAAPVPAARPARARAPAVVAAAAKPGPAAKAAPEKVAAPAPRSPAKAPNKPAAVAIVAAAAAPAAKPATKSAAKPAPRAVAVATAKQPAAKQPAAKQSAAKPGAIKPAPKLASAALPKDPPAEP